MAYNKTIWTNGVGSALNSTNLSKLEVGVWDAHQIANIKSWYEQNPDTNAFTDYEEALVSTIPAIETRTTGLEAEVVSLASPDAVAFTPQVTQKAYQEGLIYYDKSKESFVGYGSIEGAGVALGHSMHVHCYNNSGATIEKGMAVRYNGVLNGVPLIVKAIATDFINARVLGLVQADILNGTVGGVSSFGELYALDSTAYPTGVPLYLSATIAGTYTDVPPDIVTRIGGSLVSSLTEGVLFVAVINNIHLPSVFGAVRGALTPTNIVADLVNPTPISGFTDENALGLITDKVQGTIQATYTGTYRASINLVMSFDNVAGLGKAEFWLGLRNITTNVLVNEMKGWIPKDGETVAFYPSGLVSLEASSVYRLEIRSEIALTNIEYTLASFDLESVSIRE